MILERFDMSLGAGLGQLAGRVFRIGHLGDFNDLMLAGTLCGVEMGLRLAGVEIEPGVGAALELLEAASVRRDGRRAARPAGARAHPRDGRAVLRPGARGPGRGRRQGRAARHRRLVAALDGHGRLPGRQPQQALARARPQGRRAPGRIPAARRRRRRRAREQPPGRHGAARRRLRDALGAQPAARVRVDLRLRADRPVRAAGRLRPDRAGAVGRDERDRRAGRRPDQVRDPDRRPVRRAVLRRRDPAARSPRASAPAAGSSSTRRCSRARSRSRCGRRRSCSRPAACRRSSARRTA